MPAEQKVLVRLLDCAERGLTTRATAADLNGRGFRTRPGRTWTIGTVNNVLRYARRKIDTHRG
ncbi:recombinase family protein [Micromonospora saelicesensis]|uniref:recombinase family protein n=1 Tax=Micromonospora saelicesensis TaxID=285676 RepID=UPI000DD7A37D